MSKETIYYVIVGLVYLYFQYSKWKKANPSAPKAKKINKQDQAPSAPFPSTSQKSKKEYSPIYKEETKPMYERLEDSKFSYESPSLIRTVAQKKTDSLSTNSLNSKKGVPLEERKFLFSEYVAEKKPNPYAEKLKNPENVKEAFIFAEILNRKYT